MALMIFNVFLPIFSFKFPSFPLLLLVWLLPENQHHITLYASPLTNSMRKTPNERSGDRFLMCHIIYYIVSFTVHTYTCIYAYAAFLLASLVRFRTFTLLVSTYLHMNSLGFNNKQWVLVNMGGKGKINMHNQPNHVYLFVCLCMYVFFFPSLFHI